MKGYRYTIDYVEETREVDRELSSTDYIGQVCPGNPGRIRVLAGMQPIGVLDSVIHEIVHVIFARNGVLRAAIRPEIGEEPFVDAIATELANLIVSNGWIQLPDKIKPTLRRITCETA